MSDNTAILREALIRTLDSPTIEALSRIFSPDSKEMRSCSEQVAEALLPNLDRALTPAAGFGPEDLAELLDDLADIHGGFDNRHEDLLWELSRHPNAALRAAGPRAYYAKYPHLVRKVIEAALPYERNKAIRSVWEGVLRGIEAIEAENAAKAVPPGWWLAPDVLTDAMLMAINEADNYDQHATAPIEDMRRAYERIWDACRASSPRHDAGGGPQ